MLLRGLAEFSDGFSVNFEGSDFHGFIICVRGRVFVVGTIFVFSLGSEWLIVEYVLICIVFVFLIIGIKDR